jgi:hypothetical protein
MKVPKDDSVIEEVKMVAPIDPRGLLPTGIKSFVSRWQRVVEKDGDYIENSACK